MNSRILLSLLLFGSIESFAAKIILLNGTSSAGKTTIAEELQRLSDDALLRTGIDHFCDMILRERYDEFGSRAEEGWNFSASTDSEGNPIVHISLGALAKKCAHTMPKVIKCLADEGHDVVVDEVLIDKDDLALRNYAQGLKEHDVYFVGVVCSLEELESREKSRGDRVIGLARGLLDITHKHKNYYDMMVDTTYSSGAECAQEIWNKIEGMPTPQGFTRFRLDNEK